MIGNTRLTMLNSMASRTFVEAMDQFVEWGLEVVDLKGHILGKSIEQLDVDVATTAAKILAERKLEVYCFSTSLFDDEIEKGEEHFREHHLNKLFEILQTAEKLQPAMIRLLAAKYNHNEGYNNSLDYIHDNAPWLIPLYQEAVDMIYKAGFQVTIENECNRCIFSTPEEIVTFFNELDRSNKVHFTYDAQNLWQMGTYPSLEVYNKLKPLIGYLHLKGGQSGDEDTSLVWKSSLEDASWAVSEMVIQAVRDGISPVICLNSSHGMLKEGYPYSNITERDLSFVRSILS